MSCHEVMAQVDEHRVYGKRSGGASRDRTDDLIVANDALSQLSYSPTLTGKSILSVPTQAAKNSGRDENVWIDLTMHSAEIWHSQAVWKDRTDLGFRLGRNPCLRHLDRLLR